MPVHAGRYGRVTVFVKASNDNDRAIVAPPDDSRFLSIGQRQRLEAVVGTTGLSRKSAMLQAAAFTLLNPHVYLDTVLLMGSIGAQHGPASRGWFILGASTASPCWLLLRQVMANS